MHSELKTYKNKNIGQFTSIPLKLSAGDVSDANLDCLYLATHFHKLRTQTVAHVRKSKHYATTLAAWQKKLKGVDVSDLAAVAKTLGLNVEVFNPLASASSESHKTLFSGGGRSKRKAQLLKVKKGVYKPMKAGALNRETYEQGLEASNVAAEAFKANRLKKEDCIRILKDENSTEQQIQSCVDDDEIYIDTWNKLLNEEDRRDSRTLIMRKKTVNIEIKDDTAVIPDELKKCELARRESDSEQDEVVDGITFPKGWPECPISYMPVGPTWRDKRDDKEIGFLSFYQARDPSSGNLVCYHIDSIDRLRKGYLNWLDSHLQKPAVLFKLIIRGLKNSNLVSSKAKRYIAETADELEDIEYLSREARRQAELAATNAYERLDEEGLNALHKGVLAGNLVDVRRLIEFGVNVDARDGDGRTSLHMSAEEGLLSITRLLIVAGANVNAVVNDFVEWDDQGKWTPLRYSAEKGHLEVTQLLIESGASMNLADEFGVAPLHASAHNGHLPIARLLIRRGVSVDARDDEGKTPLHYAAERKQLELSKFLIEKGADVNARNNYDDTPIDIDPRLAEFQQNGVQPRQREEDDEGQDRNVRQRVGGGGKTGIGLDFNADSRGARYSEDDAKLAKAIEVLFRKMCNVSMKNTLQDELKEMMIQK